MSLTVPFAYKDTRSKGKSRASSGLNQSKGNESEDDPSHLTQPNLKDYVTDKGAEVNNSRNSSDRANSKNSKPEMQTPKKSSGSRDDNESKKSNRDSNGGQNNQGKNPGLNPLKEVSDEGSGEEEEVNK